MIVKFFSASKLSFPEFCAAGVIDLDVKAERGTRLRRNGDGERVAVRRLFHIELAVGRLDCAHRVQFDGVARGDEQTEGLRRVRMRMSRGDRERSEVKKQLCAIGLPRSTFAGRARISSVFHRHFELDFSVAECDFSLGIRHFELAAHKRC